MWERSRLGRSGRDPDDINTIRLLAGTNSAGGAVHEEVPIELVDHDSFRLIVTPGLVEDLAADDVVRVGADGSPELVSRGGNLAVKLYTPAGQQCVLELLDEVEALGGWLDGFQPPLVVMTFAPPLRFVAIEALLREFVVREGDEWFYGNAYSEDGAPLNWWNSSR